jgi:UDP-N-acetyl-D-glucosamine dehydrogenase
MPEFVVRKVASALNEERKAVNGSRIHVLGVAYKKDIDDMRESPALDVMRLLEERGAHVDYHDPWVPSYREDGHAREGVPLTEEILEQADAVVIVTDHSNIDYQRVIDHSDLVVDTRNATTQLKRTRARIVSLASNDTTAG